MPLPLLPLIAAGGGAFVGNAIGGFANRAISTMTNPLLVPGQAMANWNFQTQYCSPSDLFPPYLQGKLSDSDFRLGLAYNNIRWNQESSGKWINNTQKFWTASIESMLPRLSLEQLYYLLYSGVLTKNEFIELCGKWKMADGHSPLVAKLMLPKFDQGVIFTNYFRGFTSKDDTMNAIRKYYGCNKDDADKILNSSQFVPPPTDLIRFVAKDVYNDDQINLLGLADEYDTVQSALPWARAAGISKDTTVKYGGQEYTRDILRDYWIAHWQLMSPTQGYTALHRLRPERLFRYLAEVPGLKPFEFTQLNALLKSNDYVPEQRKWLAASSYNLLGRIDLRRVYGAELIDKNELKERYRDAGYALPDAELLTEWTDSEREKKKDREQEKEATKNYGKYKTAVYAAYKAGTITRAVAITSLVTKKFDTELISADLDAIDIDIYRLRAEQYIKMVKSQFFLGLYDGQEAYFQLTIGGLQDQRASQYVILWQRQLSLPRKMASVQTILDWVKRGLMNFGEASQRLLKLGFSNGDTLLYLESAQMDIEKKIQMEQIAIQRTEKQQQKEVQAMFRQLASAQKAAQAQLRTYSSIPTMKRWYIRDEIDWATIQDRMVFLGIPPEDIARYQQEFNDAKGI